MASPEGSENSHHPCRAYGRVRQSHRHTFCHLPDDRSGRALRFPSESPFAALPLPVQALLISRQAAPGLLLRSPVHSQVQPLPSYSTESDSRRCSSHPTGEIPTRTCPYHRPEFLFPRRQACPSLRNENAGTNIPNPDDAARYGSPEALLPAFQQIFHQTHSHLRLPSSTHAPGKAVRTGNPAHICVPIPSRLILSRPGVPAFPVPR